MKDLYQGIRLIIRESTSVFCKDAITGRLSFDLMDVLFFIVMPLFISIIVFYLDLTINARLSESIIGILSLFVVLAFQVVYIATDKFATRVNCFIQKRKVDDKVVLYEDDKNYLRRIGNYTRQFVRLLVLLLLISLIIILCSTIDLCVKKQILHLFISALILSLFYLWLILLLKMIVSIYRLQMDDIRQNYNMIS